MFQRPTILGLAFVKAAFAYPMCNHPKAATVRHLLGQNERRYCVTERYMRDVDQPKVKS